jgi:hypothetical protein
MKSSQAHFAASWGSLTAFLFHHAFCSLNMIAEASAADHVSAKEFHTLFKKIIAEGVYTLKKVSNLNKTGLFLKHMPSCPFISTEEKTTPRFKAA